MIRSGSRVVLRKPLTVSERRRHIVLVPAAESGNFPERSASGSYVNVRLRYGSKEKTAFIDSYNRLYVGSDVFNELDLDSVNSVVIIEEMTHGVYKIRRE